MKKEDRKYYALPDGTVREIPSDLEVPDPERYTTRGDHDQLDFDGASYEDAWKKFEEHISNQPAIYTDEKFPVGVVEGEIEVKHQFKGFTNEGIEFWYPIRKTVYDTTKDKSRLRLFATRKREEVNTEKHSDREMEELADSLLEKQDSSLRYENDVISVRRARLAMVEMYHAGFKAAQEIQGEEMTIEEAWRAHMGTDTTFLQFLKDNFTTIKKKQQ